MRTGTEEFVKERIQPTARSQTAIRLGELVREEVQTRFGKVSIRPDKSIRFPHGLLGIPGDIHFCLADFPAEDMRQFKLLQCLEDKNLCFIVVPAGAQNTVISAKDVEEAAETLAIAVKDLVLLFILTVHSEQGKNSFSINARAPIFVDATTASATQLVLSNTAYEIRHYIS